MSSIKFDFRVGTVVRRTPRFRRQKVCEFDLPGSLAKGAPAAPAVFGEFRRAADVGSIFAKDPPVNSDPRSFSKIVVYACAIRRGELTEFEGQTGLRLAGPAAATLAEDAKVEIPTGTVFAGLTRHGTRGGRPAWVTLVNVARPEDPCRFQRKAVAGSAKITHIACVE